ncbi:MAG: YdcF family protein [Clostridia bacterium]|nr:YdcF family protein [Clostridia bacterium]MBQ7348267.1 YdcF family protein [Clostridia bacterium]
MKISQITLEKLMSMTPSEKWNIVCKDITDDGAFSEFALLLGSCPELAEERAITAAKLYHEGRVKYIVPSGGVSWINNGVSMTEACFMSQILTDNGVPAEAIVIENEALTTRENMIYGTLQINRKCRFNDVSGIALVTSFWHMKRSLMLARAFLPKMIRIHTCPTFPNRDKEEWLCMKENINLLDNEIRLLKNLADTRMIEDLNL